MAQEEESIMNATNKHATPEQIKRIKAAVNAPLVAIHTGTPRTALQVAHDCAIEQGLPEIDGYYGINLETGEFFSA